MGRFNPTSKQIAILKEQGVPTNDCVKLGKRINMLGVLRSGHVHPQVLQDVLIELLDMEVDGMQCGPAEFGF